MYHRHFSIPKHYNQNMGAKVWWDPAERKILYCSVNFCLSVSCPPINHVKVMIAMEIEQELYFQSKLFSITTNMLLRVQPYNHGV